MKQRKIVEDEKFFFDLGVIKVSIWCSSDKTSQGFSLWHSRFTFFRKEVCIS